MWWIHQALLNCFLFAAAVPIAGLIVLDEWLDRRREARTLSELSDVGSLKEERWNGHLRA